MKRQKDIRPKTVTNTLNILTHVASMTKKHGDKDGYAPDAKVWFVIEGFDDDTKEHIIANLNKHYNRKDNMVSLRFLKTEKLIDIKKIEGVKHIKWVGTEPTHEMAHDLCVKINNQKNHRNEIPTPGETGSLHTKELVAPAAPGKENLKEELTDSQKLDAILKKVSKVEAVLAELCGKTIE
jgi:hypothetical protein